MKSRGRLSPLAAVAVAVLCVAFIELSDSASITGSDASPSPTTTSASSNVGTTSIKPTRVSSSRTVKPRQSTQSPVLQAGRMKASDIKACISKAFCEVNSMSVVANYAVNEEFFDIMNQIHALSDEELDSGSTSVEDDDDEDGDDDDADSSEESGERGYPPGPPPPGFRLGRNLNDNSTSVTNDTITNSTTVAPSKSKRKKMTKKKMKVMSKKYVNGTFISVPKRRRSRIETAEEKAQRNEYLTRKQREMGQVNDLAALIRISADIGLTLRSPRKCRTLFNKCTMSHEQIVDLFNQTLLAVTTPATSSPKAVAESTSTATKLKAAATATAQPTTPVVNTTTAQTPTTVTTTTTLAPSTTTLDNRNSKSRQDFSDEDVEYMTDTEIQPVATYALFVNDPPEDSVKTAEEVNVQETFKKYANTFPSGHGVLSSNLPALKRSNGRRKKQSVAKRRNVASSEEEDEDEEDDDATSMSTENKLEYRPEQSYTAYRVNAPKEEGSKESAEPSSIAKESSEGILPPLVQKETVNKKVKIPSEDEDEEDEEDESDEEEEADLPAPPSPKPKQSYKAVKKSKKTPKPVKPVPVEEEESSEEDDVEAADDDNQAPPPWTPVYSLYMAQKQKDGYKKKQKGPYKGGEGAYSDSPQHSTSAKKPWGGSSHSQEATSHESIYPNAYQGHAQTPYGVAPEEATSEQKQGFFQSIMSWFTGNKNEQSSQQQDSPYPSPYGQQSVTGAPWSSQEAAGAGQSYANPQTYSGGASYHRPGYRHDSSEEEEDDVEVEEFLPKSKKVQNKRRRYRGRSDSIITSGIKKSSPPPPVVILPKETKSKNKSTGGKSAVKSVKSKSTAFEPSNNFETLMQADGGNLKKKSSSKDNKRTKKEAVKSKPKRKSQKQSQRGAHDSAEDDDEAFSSEELYNKKVNKLSMVGSDVKIGSSSSVKSQPENDATQASKDPSFPSYFESMFGTEDKFRHQPKEKDDGTLLYGFESLSSQLNASPSSDLPLTAGAGPVVTKVKSSYKINKTKKKQTKKPTTTTTSSVKVEADSSEEVDDDRRKK